jgi:hypothetical protein
VTPNIGPARYRTILTIASEQTETSEGPPHPAWLISNSVRLMSSKDDGARIRNLQRDRPVDRAWHRHEVRFSADRFGTAEGSEDRPASSAARCSGFPIFVILGSCLTSAMWIRPN